MQENPQTPFESASAQGEEPMAALIPTPFDVEMPAPDELQANSRALNAAGFEHDSLLQTNSLFDEEDFQLQEPGNPVWKFLADLLNYYPLVFWAGMWAIVLVAGAIAVTLLTNPKVSRREPLPNLPSTKLDVSDGHFPLWPLGLIALACAGGTLVLARRLDHQKRLAELPAPLTLEEINAVFPNLASADPTSVEVRVHPPLELAAAQDSAPQRADSAADACLQSSTDTDTGTDLHSAQSPVEVLPPFTAAPDLITSPNWQKPPLDYRAPGLAEVLEIQRRRSHKRRSSH